MNCEVKSSMFASFKFLREREQRVSSEKGTEGVRQRSQSKFGTGSRVSSIEGSEGVRWSRVSLLKGAGCVRLGEQGEFGNGSRVS